MPSVRVTPVVGLPQFDGWSQVVESPHSSFGSIVVSLAVEGSHAGNVGRDLTTLVTQSSLFSFEEFYTLLEEIITVSSENDTRVLFAAGCFTKQQCAYATYNGAVLLKRDTKIGRVLSSGNQLKMITGVFSVQDVVVFSSLSSAHFFNEIEQKFTLGFDVDTIVTSVVPGVHAESNSSLSSLAFVTYGVQQEDMRDPFEEEVLPEEVQTQLSEELAATLDEPLVSREVGNANSGQVVRQFISIWKHFFILVKKASTWVFRVLVGGIKQVSKVLRQMRLPTGVAGYFSKLVSRDTYIETATEKKKKIVVIVAAVFLMLLIVGIVQLLSARKRARETTELENRLAPIAQDITRAQEQLSTDPVTARDMLQNALGKYKQVATEYKPGSHQAKSLAALITQTQTIYDQISGLEELAQLSTFYDLRLVNSNFISRHAVMGNGTIYFFDSETKVLVVLELDTKKVVEVEMQNSTVVRDIALLGSKVLFLGEGISGWSDGTETTELLEEGDSNRAAVLLGTYENFVYVVNPEKRNVYRYVVEDDTFSEPVGWMQVTRGLEYDKIHSIAIDGDMWVGTKDGSVHKFTRGEEQEFAIRGLDKSFSGPLLISTTVQGDKLYILEPDTNRVVILSKQGDFLKAITNVALGSATELLVDESRNMLLVVSGSIIFEIPLSF